MQARLSRALIAAGLLAALPAGATEAADGGTRGADVSAVSYDAAQAGAGRDQVLALLDRLESAPGTDGQRLDEVRARLDGLDGRSAARLGQLLDQHPEWGEVPTILEAHTELMAGHDDFLLSRGIAPMSSGQGAASAQDGERFRAELLFLMRQLRQLAPLMAEGYDARLAQAALAVEAMTPDALDTLRAAYFRQMVEMAAQHPEMKAGGTGMTPTVAEAFTCPSFTCGISISIPDSCDSFLGVEVCLSDIISLSISIDLCSLSGIDDLLTGVCEDITGFLDDAISDITGAFDTVVDAVNALPAQLEVLAGAIVDGVLLAIAELLEVLPNDAGELIEMLADAGGFDATSDTWYQVIPGVTSSAAASTAAATEPLGPAAIVMPLEPGATVAGIEFPTIEFPDFNLLPPCPARGDILPVVGLIGSADAELRCRKIDAMLNDVFDLIPGDTKMLPGKIAGALVYFPVNYLCLCAQQQSETHNINTSLAFHGHATARMDAVISDVASAASLGALRNGLSDTNDTVDETNTTLASALARAQALDGTVAGQNLFLETLTLLLDRLDLEEALLDVHDGDEHLLALPESLGGRFGDVETVVWDTIQGALAAGQPVYQALAHFQKAQNYESASDWGSAYWELQQAYQQAVKTTAVKGVTP